MIDSEVGQNLEVARPKVDSRLSVCCRERKQSPPVVSLRKWMTMRSPFFSSVSGELLSPMPTLLNLVPLM